MSKKLKGNTGVKGGQIGNTNAEKWTEDALLKVGKDLLEWMKVKSNMFYEEFLLDYDLYDTFLSNYREKYPSFSKLVSKADKIQEMKLKKLGLDKTHDSSMTKFCLINHHGFVSEKTQTEQTGTQKIEFVDTVVSKKI
jgi:hypothetical protein